jgi:hypothetical protein
MRGGSPVLAGALAVAVLAMAVTILSRQEPDRVLALVLLVPGFALGVLGARTLRRRRDAGPARERTAVERFNDGAFVVVLVAVWAIGLGLLGAWAGLLSGFAAGLLVGAGLRGAQVRRAS